MTGNKPPAGDADHARLRELGYKQELKRHLSCVIRFLASLNPWWCSSSLLIAVTVGCLN
jgi:hypothetical protein